jgi:hypothetical protein
MVLKNNLGLLLRGPPGRLKMPLETETKTHGRDNKNSWKR